MSEGKGESVSPGSRIFHAPGFEYYVIAVIGVKTRIDPQLVKQGLINTLLNHPRFSSILVPTATFSLILTLFCLTLFPSLIRQKQCDVVLHNKRYFSGLLIGNGVCFGHRSTILQVQTKVKEGRKWRWNPTTVNIEDHVIVAKTEPHLDFPEADRFLEDYVSNVTKTPLDISKPLWEIHLLINLKTSESEAVCVMRIHHSLGDGASLMSLLLAASRKTSDPLALPTVPVLSKTTTTSHHHRLSGCCSLWWFLLAIWGIVTLLWNTLVDLVMFALTILFLRDSDTPLKGVPAGPELHTMRFVHRHLCLDDVKLVKTAMKMDI